MSQQLEENGTSPTQIRTLIDEICSSIGPRASGSDEESRAARWLKDRLEAWRIEATIESFHVAPSEVHTLIVLIAGCYIVAYFASFFSQIVAFVSLSSLVVLALVNRLLDSDLVESVLPKRWSTNVIGKIKPVEETKRVVIVAGHHDSAFYVPLHERPRLYPLYKAAVVVVALSALGIWLISLWDLVMLVLGAGSTADFPGYVLHGVHAIGALGVVISVVFVVGGIRTSAVPGANDNLSAVAVAWEVGRRLAVSPPKHTEIWIASFGSEELGLKGSRQFALQHGKELRDALLINLESVGQSGNLNVLTGELPLLVRHSERAITLVEEAAVSAEAHIQRRFLIPGLTDAASFSRYGLEATTLIRMTPEGYLEHYHVPADNPESISEANLEEALQVCLKAIELIDGGERLDEGITAGFDEA